MIYGERLFMHEDCSFDAPQLPENDTAPVKESSTFMESLLYEAMTQDSYIAECIAELSETQFEAEYDYDHDYTLNEGANTEYTKLFKDHCKSYKANMKEGKKLYKAEKYSEAKKAYAAAEKDADQIIKDFNTAVKDDNAGSVIAGYFLNWLVSVLIMLIPIVGSIGYSVASFNELINFIKGLIDDGVNAKTLNLYRNKLLAATKLLKQIAASAQKKCDSIKESYDYDDYVFDLLYERAEMLDTQVVQEGANAEYTEIFKRRFKAMRKEAKMAKDAFKASDFKNAKIHYTNAKKECIELDKEFNGVDDTILSTVLGFFIDGFVSFAPLFLASVAIAIPTAMVVLPLSIGGTAVAAGGAVAVGAAMTGAAEVIAASVSGATQLVVRITEITVAIVEIVNLVKNWQPGKTEKNLNFYRNKLQAGIKLMESGYDKKIAQCSELIKAKEAAKKK